MEQSKNEQYGTSTKSFLIEQGAGACPWTPSMGSGFPGTYPNFCSNSQFQGFGGGDPNSPPCNYVGEYDLTQYQFGWSGAPPFGICSDQSKPCIVYDTDAGNFRIADPTNTMGSNPCDTGCDWNTTLDNQGTLSFSAYECDGNGTCNERCDGTHSQDIFNTLQDCNSACSNTIPDQDIGCADPLASNYGSGSGGPGVQYGVCVSNGVVDPTACIGCDYNPSNGTNSGTAQAGNDACCTYSAGACLDSRTVQDGTGTNAVGLYIATNSAWDVGTAYPGGDVTDCGQSTTPTIQLQAGGSAPWYGFPVSTPVDLGCCTYNAASTIIGCMNPIAPGYDSEHMFDCSTIPVQYKDENGNNINDPLGQVSDSDPNGYGDESCCGWILGCTDQIACNYNANANQDDGSCVYWGCGGCNDPLAVNYFGPTLPCNSTGNPADENDCCAYGAGLGCPDDTMSNYDPTAKFGCAYYQNGQLKPLITGLDWENDNSLHTGTWPLGPGNAPTTPYNQWPSFNIATSGQVGYPDTKAYVDCALNPGDEMCDCCIAYTYGCTDSQANNYDVNANTEDGSCTYTGCPNSTASDYWLNTITPTVPTYTGAGCEINGTFILGDDTPVQNGGCCTYPLDGCMDSTACNFNGMATTDDGSCCYSSPCEGCQETGAFNEDPNACISNASLCLWQGCVDDGFVTDLNGNTVSPFPGIASIDYLLTYTIDANGDDITDQNYDPQTGWNSNCQYQGCADPDSPNYNSNHDGCGTPPDPQNIDCCTYRVGCTEPTASNYTDPNSLTPPYLIPCNSSTVPQEPHLQLSFGQSQLTLVNGDDYLDTIGDSAWDAGDNNDCCEVISGCMDPLANNYDSNAGVDSGNCEYLIGCTEPGYSNTITSGCCGAPSATAIACQSNGNTTGSFPPDGDEVGQLPETPLNPNYNNCCEIYGCTDQGTNPFLWDWNGGLVAYMAMVGASNYDPNATVDDGSCVYPTYGCNDVAGGATNTVAGAGGCIDERFGLGTGTYDTLVSNPYVVAFDTGQGPSSDPNYCCTYPDTDNYVICEGTWTGNQNDLNSPVPGNPGWGSCSSSLSSLDVEVQNRLTIQGTTGVQLVWSSPDGVQVEYPPNSGNMVDQAYADCMNDGCGDCELVPAEGCVWCDIGAASDTCSSSQSIQIVAEAFSDAPTATKMFNTLNDCQGDSDCYIERFGCTDQNYCEYYTQAIYDAASGVWTNQASVNDGSCLTPIQYGCTDPLSSGGGQAGGGTCNNINPDANDPYDTAYDPYAAVSGTDVITNYGNVYQGLNTSIDISATDLSGNIGYPINWIDTSVVPNFVAAGNNDCEFDCEEGAWGGTVNDSFLQVYAKMGAANPSPNFGNNNSCFACDGATCQEFGPGDETALDTFIINMWAGGNPNTLSFYNTLGECNTNSPTCGQNSYCADDGLGDPVYDVVRGTAGPGGTAWPQGTPACNYDASTATPGLSCPCQNNPGQSSPECCCEYTSCLACADPTALNEGERCDQTMSGSQWLVQDECPGGSGPGNVLLGGTNPCCYDMGCTDPTAGPNPDVNGNGSDGLPCTSPCANGYAATNFDPIACQDDPNTPCEYNTDPDFDCVPHNSDPNNTSIALCTEVPAGTGTYNTLNQCIATGCGSNRWACVEYNVGPACFIDGSMVLMANGEEKNIAEVKIGEEVKSEFGISKVTGLDIHKGDFEIYSFNGGKPFTTAEHPFKTIEGWKALNPTEATKIHGVETKVLKEGDTLVKIDGEYKLKEIIKDNENHNLVYNLKLDNEHVYYVNNYLVHNKISPNDFDFDRAEEDKQPFLSEQPVPLVGLQSATVDQEITQDFKWPVSWVGGDNANPATFDCCENDPEGPYINKQDCIENSVCDDCTAVRWKCVVDPNAGTATGNNCVDTVAADPDCIAGNCHMSETDCIQSGCEHTDKKWICTMEPGIGIGHHDHEKLPMRKDDVIGEQNVMSEQTIQPCIQSGFIGYDSQQDCHNSTPCGEGHVDPCFTPETLVTMADNTKKEISKIEVGEKVLNANGGTSEVIQVHIHECSYEIYGFNGEKAFLTAEHPLLTDSGWRAVNPKETQAKHGIEAATLKVGDYLLKDNGEKVKIESIEKAEERVPKVYHISLYEVPTHYANDYIAHNGVSDPKKNYLSIKGWEKELNEYYKKNEKTLLNEDPNVPDPNACPNKDEAPCPNGCNGGTCVPIALAWCGSIMCQQDPVLQGCSAMTWYGAEWRTCSQGFRHNGSNDPPQTCVKCVPGGGNGLGNQANAIGPGNHDANRGLAPNGECCIRKAYITYNSMASGGCHATDWVDGSNTYGTSTQCAHQPCQGQWSTNTPCNGYTVPSFATCQNQGGQGSIPCGASAGGTSPMAPPPDPEGCIWCELDDEEYWDILIPCLFGMAVTGNEDISLVCHDLAVASTTGGYFAPVSDDPNQFPNPAPTPCNYNAADPIVQQWWYPEEGAEMPFNSQLDWQGECADAGYFNTNGFSGWWSQTPYASGLFNISYSSRQGMRGTPGSKEWRDHALSRATTEEQKNKLRKVFGYDVEATKAQDEPVKQPDTVEPTPEPTREPVTPTPEEPTSEPTTPETQELKEQMERIKKLMGL